MQPLRRIALCLIFSVSLPAMAATISFTFMPESSPPYPSGTYGSNSSDPLGPTIGLSVSYVGINGGSSEFLPRLSPSDRDAFLVYRFRLDFSNPVLIENVTMTGWGDNRPLQSQMRLLDAGSNVLATESLVALDQPLTTWVLSGNGATGTTFFYDEFDGSGVVRFRSGLTVTFSDVPEPSTATTALTGLVLLCAAMRRVAFRHR